MNTVSTDARLVTEYLAGDTSALAAIYDRYGAGLYDTAAAMLSDRHDAADMVQDVFCIAAERLSQLRDPDRLKPWLYSVLRHEVYRRSKKRKRAVPVDFQDQRTPDVVSSYDPEAAGEAVVHAELASLVRAAARGLDERDRLVLELSVRQGLTGADLADALGVTPDQSYSLVHRMRDRVEKSLGALTVARAGRRECDELARILGDWDGDLTVLLRKRVNRHVEQCATCERTRTRFAPLALFGAAPAFLVPDGLRERVLAAAGARTGSEPPIRFDANHGFPRATRLGRHAAWWAAAATLVAVVGGGVLIATGTGDGADGNGSGGADIVIVDSTTGRAPSTTTVTSTETSTVTSTVTSTETSTETSTDTSTVTSATTIASSGTSGATLAVQSVQIPTTRLDFGRTATSLSVMLRNPNSFPVSYSMRSSSNRFAVAPAAGNLAASQQITLVVTFDRNGATSDSSNFPTGPFTHVLEVTTTAGSNVSSSVARTSLVGTIDPNMATTTAPPTTAPATTAPPTTTVTTTAPPSTAPQPGLAVTGVTGSLEGCVALSASAVVTGSVASVSLTVEYRSAPGGAATATATYPMAAGPNGSWSVVNQKVQPPAGTTNVLVRVTATPPSGPPATASRSFATTC